MSEGVPDFQALRAMYHQEVEGLSDAQLDWEDPSEDWSRWSIRRQVSMWRSPIFSWWVKMWGKTLWPENPPEDRSISPRRLPTSTTADWMRRNTGSSRDLLPKFDEAIHFAERAAEGKTDDEINSLSITRAFKPEVAHGRYGPSRVPVLDARLHVSRRRPRTRPRG